MNNAKVLNLREECELRAKLRESLTRTLSELTAAALAPAGESDLPDLTRLLFDTIEERKRLEEEERALKEVIRGLSRDRSVTIQGDYVLIRETRTRSDLDREKIKREFGESVYEQLLRNTEYEVMSVKKIAEE